jgi:hypothetical protein
VAATTNWLLSGLKDIALTARPASAGNRASSQPVAQSISSTSQMESQIAVIRLSEEKALDAILTMWGSADTYANRIAAIMSSSFAESFSASTVFDDGSVDTPDGDKGTVNDRFFALVAGSNNDKVNNKDKGENVVGI